MALLLTEYQRLILAVIFASSLLTYGVVQLIVISYNVQPTSSLDVSWGLGVLLELMLQALYVVCLIAFGPWLNVTATTLVDENDNRSRTHNTVTEPSATNSQVMDVDM